MKIFNKNDFANFEKRYRANFVNSLSGVKSANLIGTRNKIGQENLAMFSSCVHLGASPALIGLVNRPEKDGAVRHTLNNIKEQGFFTINDVQDNFLMKAHQTSARYPLEISEFQAVGLTSESIDGFKAPFVQESSLKVGCKLAQLIPIDLNNTVFIIGEIVLVQCDENRIDEQGRIDRSDVLAISGLDTYSELTHKKILSYAKPDLAPQILSS